MENLNKKEDAIRRIVEMSTNYVGTERFHQKEFEEALHKLIEYIVVVPNPKMRRFVIFKISEINSDSFDFYVSDGVWSGKIEDACFFTDKRVVDDLNKKYINQNMNTKIKELFFDIEH